MIKKVTVHNQTQIKRLKKTKLIYLNIEDFKGDCDVSNLEFDTIHINLIDGNFIANKTIAKRIIALDAQIKGKLDIKHAKFSEDVSFALIRTDGSISMDYTIVKGKLSFRKAKKIEGDIVLDYAKIGHLDASDIKDRNFKGNWSLTKSKINDYTETKN